MQKWLSVIGVGDEGLQGLTPIARSLFDQATLIVGGKRHLAMLPSNRASQLVWANPIDNTINQILQQRPNPVCILASGDPMCYGIGSTLLRHLSIAEMLIIPVPSAFSLACARLGWALPEVETVSLCGRDPALLNVLLYSGAKILVLSADRTTPHRVAQMLHHQGLEETQLTVLEHLGGEAERLVNLRVGELSQVLEQTFADLNTIALQLPHFRGFSRFPGLPDSAYQHDGQLTKREIRAITLSSLAPYPGELLWDVGGGSGSIAIEWMRSHPRCQAITIEHHGDRLQNIATNAQTLGVPNLQIVAGKAPEALVGLPEPDAIFIGGGLTVPGVFETCWEGLRSGGRLVANAVTVETEMRLFELQAVWGGSLNRMAIQRSAPVGKFLGWQGMANVTQWVVEKL
jgi:precorrin-6B C5,15-methyltransferase / cobalt-precorrin-6B C5,C15-methyltransferase